jgi:hypothetical protein
MRLIKRKIGFILLFYLSLYCGGAVQAWQHQIAIGYGMGKEIEQNYLNRGVVLSGKFYKFPAIDNTLYATLDGTLTRIWAATAEHNKLTTLAIALAMRAYFADPCFHCIRPYLQVSFGPAYLSDRHLGNRRQGANFSFQTTLEVGTELSLGENDWDINLRLLHYCNAGIFQPNKGINLAPVLSVGFLF